MLFCSGLTSDRVVAILWVGFMRKYWLPLLVLVLSVTSAAGYCYANSVNGTENQTELMDKGNTVYDIRNMKEEIREYEANSSEVKMDVSSITRKHILIGMDKNIILNAMQLEGFKISPVETRSRSMEGDFDEYYSCSFYYYRGILNRILGFKYEIRVSLGIRDGKISQVQGRNFYHAL